jgi:hypothetical protein
MPDIRTALKAIGLVVLVVLFNFGLYIGVYWASTQNIIDRNSIFPPLVLILSFFLSIGIILIVALGEKVKAQNIENEWIKKIGVTPIMAVVACLITLALGFSPLAAEILPNGGSQLKFLLANVGVECRSGDANKAPQATQLLAVISSTEADYISKIRADFEDKAFKRDVKNPDYVFVPPGGELYKTLKEEPSLEEDLNSDDKWFAYTVAVKAPTEITSLPIPTIYGRAHKSRLFVVTTKSVTSAPSESSALTASIDPRSKNLMPLLLLEMTPQWPEVASQKANVELTIFATNVCWVKGGVS